MWSARPVGAGFSPLDEALELIPGQFSPFLVQCIVRLGTLIPFEQVPELLVFLTGVQVSIETVRRITEQAGAAQVGAAQVAIEEREVDRLERELPAVPEGPAEQQVSADGIMIPLVHGEWAKARMVAIGTLVPDRPDDDAPHAQDITCFSRLASAHDFIRQATLPFYARGIARAETVVTITDGADWLKQLIDAHCPEAIRILDFPHAVEYLAKVAQAAFGAGTREASVWLDEWAPRLKTKDPSEVLAAIRGLPMPDAAAVEVRAQVLSYLSKRRSQIAYAQFQAAGCPIGSGMVESANKLVVQARQKGSGMHWARKNVTPMLALRGMAYSGQWETAWPGIWQELRSRDAAKRCQRRAARRTKQEAARIEGADQTPETSSTPTVTDEPLAASHPSYTGDVQPLLATAAKL